MLITISSLLLPYLSLLLFKQCYKCFHQLHTLKTKFETFRREIISFEPFSQMVLNNAYVSINTPFTAIITVIIRNACHVDITYKESNQQGLWEDPSKCSLTATTVQTSVPISTISLSCFRGNRSTPRGYVNRYIYNREQRTKVLRNPSKHFTSNRRIIIVDMFAVGFIVFSSKFSDLAFVP